MIKNKLKTIVYLCRHPRVTLRLLSFSRYGYLNEIGWINSYINKMPIDSFGRPVPWCTYGYIDFISPRLKKYMSIFEYGLGNSTLFYSDKVKKVTSVEHEKSWYDSFKNKVNNNSTIYYEFLEKKGYEKAPMRSNSFFDIIIIDGRKRVKCIKESINYLKEDGVIVLDDAHRSEYIEGVKFLEESGYKQLPFFGISPGFFSKNCTTIFYKKINCLGI